TDFDTALYNYGIDIARSVDVNLFGEITISPHLLSDSEKIFPFAGQSYIQVRTIQGQSIARSKTLAGGNIPLSEEERAELVQARVLFKTISAEDLELEQPRFNRFRVLTYFIDKPGPFDFVLQIAVPMVLLDRERGGLITFFSIAIPLVLVVAALGGLFLSRKALAPVNAIISRARAITASDMSARLPVPAQQDEIRELALTLNGLLNRLEQAFVSQETFISDA